ncbi:MAG: EAL domain-containing protein [Burkholderiales bacterium]|nr:EAL domain-containing protein [Burkholderiales bacterium]
MSSNFNLSIRKQMVLLTMLPLMVIIVSLEGYFLHERYSSMEGELLKRGQLILHQLASSSEYGFFSGNRDFLRDLARSVLNEADVTRVIIADNQSKILVSAERNAKGEIDIDSQSNLPPRIQVSTPVFKRGKVWLSEPIRSTQIALNETESTTRNLGTIAIEMSELRTRQKESSLLLYSVMTTSLFSIGIMFLVFVASRRITEPIRGMSETVHALGSGELSARISEPSHIAELQTLSAGINQMAEDLQREQNLLQHRIDEATEQLRQMAFYDTLTGLPNRRLFRDRLEQDTKRVFRNHSSLALLFLDLDRFKEVNDTLGHDKGDLLLIDVARRIKNHVRETDTFARLGGDEFAIILPDYEDRSNIERVIRDMLLEIEKPFYLGDGNTGHISGSIGIALYPQEAENIDELLKHADRAMYAAKLNGRNGFSYFTRGMQEEADEKLKLTNELRHALEKGELEVYYQPIVHLSSGKIEKAEALLRWHHPVLGMLSPNVFIPLAEESGLILEIGEWLFVETLKNIAKWKEHTGRLVQVSVNKSPVQFMRAESHAWQEIHRNSGLPGHIITVEITEGLLLSESGKVRNHFEQLKNLGIELSIDDFGTGFSALSYLHRFDVDYLKIDMSFVPRIETDSASRALTEAIIIMAHKLGIRTIAEGVETQTQGEILESFGCDFAQGFVYSKPVPANEFEKLLEE